MSVLSVHHHRVREGHSQEQLVGKRSPSHSKYGVVLRSPPDPCTCSTLQDHHQHCFYKPLAKAGQVSTTLLLCPPSSPSTGTTHHPGRKIVLCCCTCPLPGRSPPGPLFPGPPAPPPPRPASRTFDSHAYLPAELRKSLPRPCIHDDHHHRKRSDGSSPHTHRASKSPGSVPIWGLLQQSSQIRSDEIRSIEMRWSRVDFHPRTPARGAPLMTEAREPGTRSPSVLAGGM